MLSLLNFNTNARRALKSVPGNRQRKVTNMLLDDMNNDGLQNGGDDEATVADEDLDSDDEMATADEDEDEEDEADEEN